MTDQVTTVVVTRDRWDDLTRSLPHHRPPVVLVDNGSTDGTPELVRAAFPDVRVLTLSENIGAVARNLGVVEARTPYVAFADDDSWWAPGALACAAELLDDHPRLALVAARILVGPEERLDPMSTEMARSPLPAEPDLPGPPVLGFVACGAVVRREPFLLAGGFDGVVEFGGEEQRLALDLAAAGWGLAYADDVVAHHHPSARRGPQDGRRALLARNELLTAVMRLPWPAVWDTARRGVAAGPAERLGTLRGLRRAPGALRRRRVVPTAVEQRRRMLG
ncbi:glycosyltransferase family 2 protein [Nocardioides aquiterrae]|uniref:Glycosyltransferase n=1 Tax=Nocardioides aquiterrae TaxID=203799 RepID=A0ABN1ULQ7_9ACTN